MDFNDLVAMLWNNDYQDRAVVFLLWFVLISMILMLCEIWITVEPPDTKIPSVIVTKLGKQNVNFVAITTLMYHGLELNRALAIVTSKELHYRMNILQL